jgi:hypothetical protein
MKDTNFTPELVQEIETMFAANYRQVLTKQSTIDSYLVPALVAEYHRVDKLWAEFRAKTK